MKTHSIENEKIISRDSSSVLLEFNVPAESDFFDGHFPQVKLLPAVGQFEIISRFAGKYFGIPRSVASLRRMKFSAPIVPGSDVVMKLEYDAEKNSVAFRLWSAMDEKRIFSSGAFVPFASMKGTDNE